MNEDQTGGCMLDYDYNKIHYGLIAVDFSRQKELDASSKAAHQIQFVRKLKDTTNVTANTTQSMYVLTFCKKIKKKKTNIFSRECNSLTKDGKLWRSKS